MRRRVLILGSCALGLVWATWLLAAQTPLVTPSAGFRHLYHHLQLPPFELLPNCSWSSPTHVFAHRSEVRLNHTAFLARLLQHATRAGLPIVLRSGSALFAYRRNSTLNANIHLDLDVDLIAPSAVPFSTLLGALNELASDFTSSLPPHDPYHGFRVYFRKSSPISHLMLSQADLWEGFLEMRTSPTTSIVYNYADFTVLSEDLVFANADFAEQVRILAGVDVVAAFSPANLCLARYPGGTRVLSHEEPHIAALLSATYGPRGLVQAGPKELANAFDFNLVYPRWFFRAAIGKWFYCHVGGWLGNEPTPIMFSTSAWWASPLRAPDGQRTSAASWPAGCTQRQ
eukprot:TRINITY_DN51497_c0_g1_i1.p1 TRINITY_DN51497_c0_g1~~TRINITY_DN51497_c0_g1_i1.p1  ORF type:complete len:365 (+),score=44.64 TRINITY_DN51497_c0_g1_i1:67-1095(+)